MLATTFSVGRDRLSTAWHTVKQGTAQGGQLSLPHLQKSQLHGKLLGWLNSAEQLRTFVLGEDVDWHSIDVTALLLLACCLMVALCSLLLAVGTFGSALVPTQKKWQVRLLTDSA